MWPDTPNFPAFMVAIYVHPRANNILTPNDQLNSKPTHANIAILLYKTALT